MKKIDYEVIIIGGSYSGLAAALTLGRSLRQVLVIDSGTPCNIQTPYSHNFITNDGKTPGEIQHLARQDVAKYKSVEISSGLVNHAIKNENGFEIQLENGKTFTASKLIFATGIRDIMPGMEGFKECWGISVLHCPYCHGYEVSNANTGILGNGEYMYDFSTLISNWTNDLTLFTNGPPTLTTEQLSMLRKHDIEIVEKPVVKLEHSNGYIEKVVFSDGTKSSVKALYAPVPFEQQSNVPAIVGCDIKDGYITIDTNHKTTVDGVFACGDNVTRMRTVANAVSMGTLTGVMVNRELVVEKFNALL